MMDEQASRLVVQAHEMALSFSRFNGHEPESPEYEKELTRLQIYHMFPNLDAHDQCLLLSLKYARRVVMLAFNAARNVLDVEDFVKGAEERFLKAKKVVSESHICEKLNPVQRRVLEKEFFHIDLDGEVAKRWVEL
jgi:hypothetical protein